MKEIVIWAIFTGLIFLIFGLTLILGWTKKKKNLKIISFFAFLVFTLLGTWTCYKFVAKSYHKVAEVLKPRAGDEIYEALFGKRQTNCVKILNYQDQVVPKIDYAIWLHFEACANETKRILSRHEFTREKLATTSVIGKIPYGETISWFNPKAIGDTVLVYEFSTNDNRSIQTIWTSLDSTKVFCRDIFD